MLAGHLSGHLASTVPAALSGLAAAVSAVAAAARAVPEGPGYSVLLIFHVAAALVGFGAVGATGLQAARVRRGPSQPGAEGVRRYFEPGVNWAGRVLYLVPVLGFALLADSGGAFDVADAWVVTGIGLWLAAVTLAETILWPGERRIQIMVSSRWDDPDVAPVLDEECRRVAAASVVSVVMFVAAVVVMVSKP